MTKITLHQLRPVLPRISLFEIVFILVLLALIVGGLSVGRSFIRAAELQSIITDKERYLSAARQFRAKYNALPGDMPGATKIWGEDPCGCPCLAMGNENNTKPRTQTCNGNGNGLIENDGVDNDAMFEHFRAWQQLAAAGLIGGNFTGAQGAGGAADTEPGTNVPPSRINILAGFEWTVLQSATGLARWYVQKFPAMQANHQYLLFGGITGHPLDLRGRVLIPREAAGIDAKIDDGMPVSGRVMSGIMWDGKGRCTTEGPFPEYNFAAQTPYCLMLFDAPL